MYDNHFLCKGGRLSYMTGFARYCFIISSTVADFCNLGCVNDVVGDGRLSHAIQLVRTRNCP